MSTEPVRTIAVWCPDWPVVAALAEAGLAADLPAAVLHGNLVLACSQQAREAGVRRGQRRREAQSRCPELAVLARTETVEARAFEPVVAALESIAPGVEITRPGLAAIAMRGPQRYFGGETAVLHALSRALQDVLAGEALIGVADGSFAAEQAARRGVIVAAGESGAFLAGLPIDTLDLSGATPLIDLLRRLGLSTLGAFAALPARDVLARFGPAGVWAHRQAGGRDERPLAARRPPVEFAVTLDLEPALERVDQVAFSARGTAEQFITDLADHGLACTCLELQAVSDRGTETVRRWRHAGVLSTSDVIDRVRWQLEGWLSGGNLGRPAGRRTEAAGPRCDDEAAGAGIVRLRLLPVEVVPTGAHQQALWGGPGAHDERVGRALARVQTLLGHGSVLTAVLDGGRGPGERTRLVPWGDEPTAVRSPQQPWPGSLPAPAPSVLLDPPRPARVLDDAGRTVVVTERGLMPRPPARFAIGDATPVAVTSWAGPWPVDERWWHPDTARQVVRCQLVDVRGRAFLVSYAVDLGSWQVEAVYD